MPLVEVNNRTRDKIDLVLVKRAAKKFLKFHKKGRGELSIAFIGDKAIRKLNKSYRKIDRITDVLTFAGDGDFLGEIIIDYKQIKRQAKREGHPAKKELIFILTHGLLHLVGFNDKTEKGRLGMIRKGEEFIKNLGFRI